MFFLKKYSKSETVLYFFCLFFDDYETILQTAGQKKNGMFWEEFSPF